jgi:hypothetical protein
MQFGRGKKDRRTLHAEDHHDMDEPFDNNWCDEEDEEPNEEDRINLDR